jgi:hypothetical protein
MFAVAIALLAKRNSPEISEPLLIFFSQLDDIVLV